MNVVEEKEVSSADVTASVDAQMYHFEIYNDGMLDELIDMTAESIGEEDIPPYAHFPNPAAITSWYQRYSSARRVVAICGKKLVGHIAISFDMAAEPNVRKIIESSHKGKDKTADIGRFVVAPHARPYGVARTLLYEAQRFCYENHRVPYINIFETQEDIYGHYVKSTWDKVGSAIVRKKYTMSVWRGTGLYSSTRG